MPRSVLAWVLSAAFLGTVPVTGAGQCPCQFLNALRTPTTLAPVPAPEVRPAPPPRTCAGCCRSDHRTSPERPKGGQEKPPKPREPHGCPCDHHATANAVPAGERPDPVRAGDGWAVEATTVDAAQYGACRSHDAVPAPTDTGAIPPCRYLRYACAFRC